MSLASKETPKKGGNHAAICRAVSPERHPVVSQVPPDVLLPEDSGDGSGICQLFGNFWHCRAQHG